MRKRIGLDSFAIWLSSADTSAWAAGYLPSSGRWPCSEIAGLRLGAVYGAEGLVDLTVNGRYPEESPPADELNAMVADYAATVLPKDHPCFFVVVGQFQGGGR